MAAPDNVLRVDVRGTQIEVRYPSAIDRVPRSETIQSQDVVRIVLERVDDHIHWYLHHRAGWTVHFHDGFENAAQVISWLEDFGGFSVPIPDDIAGPGGEGTIVWSSA
jgi:hypothetical protein